MQKKGSLLVGLLFVGAIVVWYLLGGGGSSVIPEFKDEELTINGPKDYAYTIKYKDIDVIGFADVPELGTVVSGDTTGGIIWGTRQNGTWGEYEICAAEDSDKCIVMTDKSGAVYVFSYESTESTEQVYASFLDLLNERGEGDLFVRGA